MTRNGFLVCVVFYLAIASGLAIAESRVQPFVLASEEGSDLGAALSNTKDKLTQAQFTVLGSYSPYGNSQVIAFTSEQLKQRSLKSERGGYGAVMRASATVVDGKVQIAYTNPIYWSSAYRLKEDNADVYEKLKTVLGFTREFGSGDKVLTAADMRKYHYTMMMEYFDDPSELNDFDNHDEAVKAVAGNLQAKKGGASEVYRLSLGMDSSGQEMTVFGVGLGAENCSGDQYIMSRIDKDNPRSTAHLPYELMVYGNEVEALYARFRIAVSWPHLPMMQSDTGATFFSIMCAPGEIEDALEAVAGK
ncbi:MAG: hypothetical protein OEZ43_12610 [Gammaproteobacteria bacterium]|nr:hypothetical protein [Gammaproteobacteria bacterium]